MEQCLHVVSSVTSDSKVPDSKIGPKTFYPDRILVLMLE
jgi:hypothetical protein